MTIKFYTSLYSKAIMALFFLALPILVNAQNCDYTQGTISFTAASGNVTADYDNIYILTASDGVIQDSSSVESFENVVAGTYNIYNVNFETTVSGGALTGVTVGENISNIGGICYEVSDPLAIVVCEILIEWTDAAAANSESTVYQPTLQIIGGDLTGVTGPITVEAIVSGTATLGTDFNPSATPILLTIPAADYATLTSLNISDLMSPDSFSIINDQLIEEDETIILELANPSGLTIGDSDASATTENIHTYTIEDDETLQIEFTEVTGTDMESIGGNLPQLTIGGAVTTGPVTIEIISDPSITGATLGDDYSIVGSSFPILVTIPAGDYTTPVVIDLDNLTTQGLSIVDDAIFELSEEFGLIFNNPLGVIVADADADGNVESSYVYTITDDDCAAEARTLTKN